MKNPFSKIFKSQPKSIPEKIKTTLKSHFPFAINIEWEFKTNKYEAIFYLSEVEHIALLSEDGELMEYKKNLWPNELPHEIIQESKKFGEIMNSIAIHRGENLMYEVIVRDNNLARRLLVFNRSAELLESKRI